MEIDPFELLNFVLFATFVVKSPFDFGSGVAAPVSLR
jgi:hypothetical protein